MPTPYVLLKRRRHAGVPGARDPAQAGPRQAGGLVDLRLHHVRDAHGHAALLHPEPRGDVQKNKDPAAEAARPPLRQPRRPHAAALREGPAQAHRHA